MGPVRVLVVDDHPPFREGLRALLASSAEIEVTGEAASGTDAVRLTRTLQPDVVLMDLNMPDMGGIEATRLILDANPHIRVLVLSMADDDEAVFAAVQVGARGYLLKGALRAEILRAISAVMSGEAIFGPAIAQRLVHYFSPDAGPTRQEAFPELTAREVVVLGLIAEHRTNPEIAYELQISPKTVANHVANILTKLQVASRADAIARARDTLPGRARRPPW